MDNLKVSIQHWRFEHANSEQVTSSRRKKDNMYPPQGWYCWAFTNNDQEFENWMEKNCPTADICKRFNSGNPMHTIYIKNEAEASWFSLKWL